MIRITSACSMMRAAEPLSFPVTTRKTPLKSIAAGGPMIGSTT
jgi:hypothetical protein